MRLVLKINLKEGEKGFDGIVSWARGTKRLSNSCGSKHIGDHEFEVSSLSNLLNLAEHLFNAQCAIESGQDTTETQFYKNKLNT